MAFISNSWFIGIITGLISGMLVYLITSRFLDNKRKRDYLIHVKDANTEVVSALKPYIAEQGLPDFDIFNALIFSSARRNAVDYNDLYTPIQFCDEIIGEIIRDVYVSSEKKKEYAEAISEYKKKIKSLQLTEESFEKQKSLYSFSERFKKGKETVISSIIGMWAGLISLVTVLSEMSEFKHYKLFNSISLESISGVLLIPLLVYMLFVLIDIIKDIIIERDSEKKRKNDISKKMESLK